MDARRCRHDEVIRYVDFNEAKRKAYCARCGMTMYVEYMTLQERILRGLS